MAPGGGTTFGSPVLGGGFSIPGSTSFGWMTPFDRFNSLLRFWAGAVRLAPGVVVIWRWAWRLGVSRAADEDYAGDHGTKL